MAELFVFGLADNHRCFEDKDGSSKRGIFNHWGIEDVTSPLLLGLFVDPIPPFLREGGFCRDLT